MTVASSKLESFLQTNIGNYLNSSGVLDEAEILGTASHVNVDILVYSKYGQSMKWLCYPASISLDNLTPDAHFYPTKMTITLMLC